MKNDTNYGSNLVKFIGKSGESVMLDQVFRLGEAKCLILDN